MSVTTTQFILMVIALVAMIWGLYAIFRSWQSKQTPVLHLDLPPDADVTDEKTGVGATGGLQNSLSKDSIPIVPRHERNLPEDLLEKQTPINTESTTETGTIATAHLSENSEIITATAQLNTQAGTTTTVTANGEIYVSAIPNAQVAKDNETSHAWIKTEPTHETVKQPNSNEPDAFSALANATEAITPVVHTYDESQLKSEVFTQKSPILDTHIQAQIDHEQNSPLHNAEQNINISIFPRHQFQRFAGKDFLSFVDKYGLKYGAMNMFHRYENKDGTGILWFSVMMVENQAPSPFDLNKLPMQHLDGLILFLSLPHPDAGQAFESMISLAKMMANDLNAELYDDVGDPLSGDSINLLKSTAVYYDKEHE